MKTQFLLFLLILSRFTYASDISKLEAVIKKAVENEAQLVITTGTNQYLLELAFYDDYYKLLKGTLLNERAKIHPENVLFVSAKEVSETDEDIIQIRMEDIIHVNFKKDDNEDSKGPDLIILQNGDTISGVVQSIEPHKVTYKKFNRKDPRTYSKPLNQVVKIVNGEENVFVVQYANLPAKKDYRFAKRTILISFVFLVIFATVALSY